MGIRSSLCALTTCLWFASFCPAAGGGDGQRVTVILISIDTLRADHLGAYGYRRVQTPHLDAFAEHGTVFTQAESQIPLTLPSHASLFTSTYPFQNRVEENAERVSPGAVTLASVLRSHGYKTAAFVGCVFLEREMGLDQGFDVYDSPFDFLGASLLSGEMLFVGAPRNPYTVRDRRDGALVVGAAMRWLSANPERPVFLFVHLFDVHQPYKAAPSGGPGGLSGYDAQIEYVDRVLGRFQRFLKEHGWWDRSLVVLLSDHGEGLGDHGESTHGYFIYESTLRVPLIFHWPSDVPQNQARVTAPAGLIDVAPTILDFLLLPPPGSFEGQSLLGMIRFSERAKPRAVYGETVHTHDAFGWAPLRSLREGPFKYINAPKPELYNVEQDPGEQTNLVSRDAARAQALRLKLVSLLARYAPHIAARSYELSAQARAQLESLGYLSAGPQSKQVNAEPDPKDRLPEYRLYEKAILAAYDGRRQTAILLLRRILAQDPHNTLARRDLAATYLAQGDAWQARSCFRQVLAAAPDDYLSHLGLGIADERLGRFPEALDQLQSACRIVPESAQCRHELE